MTSARFHLLEQRFVDIKGVWVSGYYIRSQSANHTSIMSKVDISISCFLALVLSRRNCLPATVADDCQ